MRGGGGCDAVDGGGMFCVSASGGFLSSSLKLTRMNSELRNEKNDQERIQSEPVTGQSMIFSIRIMFMCQS